jgi:hypothetical protein
VSGSSTPSSFNTWRPLQLLLSPVLSIPPATGPVLLLTASPVSIAATLPLLPLAAAAAAAVEWWGVTCRWRAAAASAAAAAEGVAHTVSVTFPWIVYSTVPEGSVMVPVTWPRADRLPRQGRSCSSALWPAWHKGVVDQGCAQGSVFDRRRMCLCWLAGTGQVE